MKTFQFNCLPIGLYTAPRVFTIIYPQASHREAEINGYLPGSVHGQHTHHGNCCRDAQRAYSHAVPPRESRVHNQQQEITSHFDPRDRVSWDGSEFPHNRLKAPRGKFKMRLEAQHNYVGSPQPLSPILLSITGQIICNQPSTTDGSTVLPLTTVLLKTTAGDQLSGLQLNRPASYPPGTRRSTVVGGLATYPSGTGGV